MFWKLENKLHKYGRKNMFKFMYKVKTEGLKIGHKMSKVFPTFHRKIICFKCVVNKSIDLVGGRATENKHPRGISHRGKSIS